MTARAAAIFGPAASPKDLAPFHSADVEFTETIADATRPPAPPRPRDPRRNAHRRAAPKGRPRHRPRLWRRPPHHAARPLRRRKTRRLLRPRALQGQDIAGLPEDIPRDAHRAGRS